MLLPPQAKGGARCDPRSAPMRRFDRLLTKIPEHTWGADTTFYLPDNANWTNAQFLSAMHQAAQLVALKSWYPLAAGSSRPAGPTRPLAGPLQGDGPVVDRAAELPQECSSHPGDLQGEALRDSCRHDAGPSYAPYASTTELAAAVSEVERSTRPRGYETGGLGVSTPRPPHGAAAVPMAPSLHCHRTTPAHHLTIISPSSYHHLTSDSAYHIASHHCIASPSIAFHCTAGLQLRRCASWLWAGREHHYSGRQPTVGVDDEAARQVHVPDHHSSGLRHL